MAETMMAAVWQSSPQGSYVQLEEREKPIVRHTRDAIIRVERAAISTNDLRILEGKVPKAASGVVLGSEFVGEVVSVGSAVRIFQPGNRVAVNCNTFCGRCWFCKRGFTNNCMHGGAELGRRIDGGQAEYVLVPYADTGLTRIPDKVSYEDALFSGNVLSVGYFGAQLANIQPGDTVAVIGAGPVGLCAMMCAKLFGAAQIIAIETDSRRLVGATTKGLADVGINPQTDDVGSVLRNYTLNRGADAVIEAAGGNNTFELAWRVARPNASVVLLANYSQSQSLPLNKMYSKNLQFKTGGVDATHVEEILRLIDNGRLSTRLLITQRGPLNDIVDGYKTFKNKEGGCLQWVITPYQY